MIQISRSDEVDYLHTSRQNFL